MVKAKIELMWNLERQFRSLAQAVVPTMMTTRMCSRYRFIPVSWPSMGTTW